MSASAVIRLIRPKHWVKNVLISLPALFAGKLMDLSCLSLVVIGIFAFSFLASASYVFNDMLDVEADRLSPTKASRPIASGDVSLTLAGCLAGFLSVCGLGVSYVFGGVQVFCVGCLYLVCNLLYTCRLKHVPLVDVWVLALFYVIRVMFGAVLSDVEVSGWMWLCVMSGALWLGLGKRLGELSLSGASTRAVLSSYDEAFLSRASWVSVTLMLAFYALWAREGGFLHLCSFPLVLFIVMRYGMVAEASVDRDPIRVALSDAMLVGACLVWLVFLFVLVYFPTLVSV